MMPPLFQSLALASFFFFPSGVLGVNSVDPITQQACQQIETVLGSGRVTYQGSRAYKEENADYWSVALSELKPSCIVLPTSAQEVSVAVTTLNKYPGAKFVVKSGGHDPNPGHSSCQDCVLIALKKLKGTVNDPSRGVAYVQPGGKWSDVIAPLASQGVTVVGGRLGIVGIGGYLTQGGLSFLSAQYGMAGDNIVEFETVLPNGTIANINAQNNPDLLVAMRGSGDQFGIVTRFTIKTYPIGKVWGGYKLYSISAKDELNAAFHDFIANNNKDLKAAIIMGFEQAVGGPAGVMVHFFYDGPDPPPNAFGKFIEIQAAIDFTKTRTYPELLNLNGRGADLLGSRTSFRSITLPYMPNNPGFYNDIQTTWANISAPFLKKNWGSLFTIAHQAFPNAIGKASEARGGNAMGLSAADNHRFILEINCLWRNAKDDAQIYAMSKQLTTSIEKMVVAMKVKDVEGLSKYNPFFANDATFDQDVLGSYKDAAKFKALQRANDPTGLFARNSGGFHY